MAVVAEQDFPPADLTWRDLHLDAAGGRLTEAASAGMAAEHFHSRGKGLRLSWEVPEDLDLIGR